MSKQKYFTCERWHIMMAEDACMNRYRKGLKKCEGCEKGKALLEAKIAELKEEQMSVVRGQSSVATDITTG